MNDYPYPKVVAAAIRGEDGTRHHLPPPARHADVINHMVQVLKLRYPLPRDEGFLCDDGYWYCREDAKLFAMHHQQLLPHATKGGSLLSTEVW